MPRRSQPAAVQLPVSPAPLPKIEATTAEGRCESSAPAQPRGTSSAWALPAALTATLPDLQGARQSFVHRLQLGGRRNYPKKKTQEKQNMGSVGLSKPAPARSRAGFSTAGCPCSCGSSPGPALTSTSSYPKAKALIQREGRERKEKEGKSCRAAGTIPQPPAPRDGRGDAQQVGGKLLGCRGA